MFLLQEKPGNFKPEKNFLIVLKQMNQQPWRHVDQQHNTEDYITEAGKFIDNDGQQVNLIVGEKFPSCPKSEKQ
ncbi:hypothetical protein [Paenibacillus sp. LHD-38]|uniref:hypothetical protein n=1 Tax=Paenibacillus sp. LHD-38 TaxID=3072143 RepID=UPI00280CE1A1|nr:hypothetical protein [Paenibacillus sp. LHD-38]MDQ8738395.1 hypothetical protein [Paenibacillus sp. LHD-38]